MNWDYFAAAAFTVALLLSFVNAVFLLTVIPTGAYVGWRLGHRLINPDGGD